MNRQLRGSTSFQGAAEDIKRGLQRIKQAQVEVMKELRREGIEPSRNHSLSYSKQSQFDNKYTHSYRLSTEGPQLNAQEGKLRQELIALAEEARKSKEAAQIAQAKMKQYEKGQERALAKAQQALANAISSQKKYIQIKNQYDRIYKSRQRHSAQLKRLQTKDLSQITTTNQLEPQLQKIAKEVRSAHETFGELIAFINSHKCFKKQPNSNNNTHNSVNLFTISTFDAQVKLNRHVNNIILGLASFQNFNNIQQVSSRIEGGQGDNTYLSGSFREDIKKIEEELEFESISKEKKLSEIENLNLELQQKNRILEESNKFLQQELLVLRQQTLTSKNKIKKLESDIELYKFDQAASKRPSQSTKSKEKTSRFEKYKKLAKMSQGPSQTNEMKRTNSCTRIRSQVSEPDPQKQYIIKIEIIEDRIIELEKQNCELSEKLKISKQNQQLLSSEIENMKNQSLRQNQIHQQQVQQLKANIPVPAPVPTSALKSEEQILEMIDVIEKLQQEKQRLVAHINQLMQKYEDESLRYQTQVQQLEVELISLKNEIQDMRKQSTTNSCHSQSNLPLMDRYVEELWAKKEEQYKNAQSLLNSLKSPKKRNEKLQQSGSQISKSQSQKQQANNLSRSLQQQQETQRQRVQSSNQPVLHGPMSSLRSSISPANMSVGNLHYPVQYAPIQNQRQYQPQPQPQPQPYPQLIKPAPFVQYQPQFQPYPVSYHQPQHYFR